MKMSMGNHESIKNTRLTKYPSKLYVNFSTKASIES